jgi:hypothetical protein
LNTSRNGWNRRVKLIPRTNFLLGPLPFTERNGILFQKEYLQDHTIKSDNGMSSLFLLHLSTCTSPLFKERPSSDDMGGKSRDSLCPRKEIVMLCTGLIPRWLRKTGAFDKKLQSQTTPGDHHGNSNLGLGFNMPLGMGMGGGMDEDREGSPTPQSGRGKKRRGSADE